MTSDTLSHVSQPAVATTVVQPRRPFWDLELGHLWEYHELLFFMVWRDVKVGISRRRWAWPGRSCNH